MKMRPLSFYAFSCSILVMGLFFSRPLLGESKKTDQIDSNNSDKELLKGLKKTPEIQRLLIAAGRVVKSRQGNVKAWNKDGLQIHLLTKLEKKRLKEAVQKLQPRTPVEDLYLDSKFEEYLAHLRNYDSPKENYKQVKPRNWKQRGFDGMWLMTLPAQYERPHQIVQLTRNTVWLKSPGNLGGIYLIEDDHWKMLIPTDDRMMKHEWTILNSNVIHMTSSSTAAGADYTGATLTRIVNLDNWPVR